MRCPLLVFAVALLLPASAQAQASFLHKSLREWLNDLERGKTAAVRRSAAFALGRMGDSAGALLPDLGRTVRSDTDTGVRATAAFAIGEIALAMGSPGSSHWDSVGRTLEEALVHPDPRVRRSAAYALGAFGDRAASAGAALRRRLKDEQASVRKNAAWALGRLGSAAGASSVADLCDLLRDRDTLVRRDAAAALGNLGRSMHRDSLKPAGRPLLDLVKGESDEVVRKTALQALAALAGPEHASYAADLYPLLESKDTETARGAAYVLGHMGGEHARKAVPVLRDALNDSDTSVQQVAAACLATMGREAEGAVSDLGSVLSKSRDPYVRRNCAIALGRIGPPAREAITALIEALAPGTSRDRVHEEVREQAAEAIAQLRYPNNEKALPAIRNIIRKESNPTVRQRCVWVLFSCRELEKHDMVPVLTEVLGETDPDSTMVRYDCARVLAWALTDRAPDRTVTVLLDMLNNTRLREFRGTDAAVERTGDEGRGGTSSTRADLGGDARFMAAEALGWMRDKVRNNPKVIDALRQAAKEKDEKLRERARRALSNLGLAVE